MADFWISFWDAVKPWLPWTVPAAVVVLVGYFTCLMLWPDRTARATGIFVVAWDSIARRFRRSQGRRETESGFRPPRRHSGEPMPPTISSFAVRPAERQKPEGD